MWAQQIMGLGWTERCWRWTGEWLWVRELSKMEPASFCPSVDKKNIKLVLSVQQSYLSNNNKSEFMMSKSFYK